MKSTFKDKSLSSESKAVQATPNKKIQAKNKDLPESINADLENSFGFDFSNVKILRNSKEANEMNARAYTQGEQIHFAPGEFNPNTESGRNLIGHEFTHIVQQRRGLVKPTKILEKGRLINEGQQLEADADSFGRKAAKGEPVTGYNSSPSLEMRSRLRTVRAKSQTIQMAKSNYGEFDDKSYTTVKNSGGKEIGVDMYLKFKPGKNVDAKLIGMVQSVRSVEKGSSININPTVKDRSIPSKDAQSISSPTLKTDEGIHIDQHAAKGYRNPLYATGKISGKDTKLKEAGTPSPVSKMTAKEITASSVTGKNYKGWGEHGYRYKSGKAWKEKSAELHDAPMLSTRTKNAEQLFETSALAIEGNQNGTYYGSVQWGWRTDAKGKFSRIPLSLQSKGTPTSSFLKAAEIWNKGKTAKDKNIQLPTKDVMLISNFAGVDIGLGPVYIHLPIGTRVVELPGMGSLTETQIRVVDGPYTGETGMVSNADLTDERN